MLNGLASVFVVFCILGVGIYFTKTRRWPDTTPQVFSATVVNIAAPALAVVSIYNGFTRELLHASGINLAIVTVSFLLMYLLGKAIASFFKMNKRKKVIFEITFVFNNSMFIGLPINQIIFGDRALPYLFTFYLVTIALFWSLGAYAMAKTADPTAPFSIKKILSPGLVGVIIGCLLVQFQLTLPSIFETVLVYLGNLCVPLSLLVIGSNLCHSISQGFPKITGDYIVIMLGKFILHPLIIFGLFHGVGIDGLPLQVFILTAALPCHAQTAILAQYYDLEGVYAANLVSLSTLVSLITIPLYASILL